MNILKSKSSVCRKLGIDPESREVQKYFMGLAPIVNWEYVNAMFYAALRNGCNQDQAYDVISDFYELYVGSKFPMSKKEFMARRMAKAKIRSSKPNAPEAKQKSASEAYLEARNAKKFKTENPELVSNLIREVKKILHL